MIIECGPILVPKSNNLEMVFVRSIKAHLCDALVQASFFSVRTNNMPRAPDSTITMVIQ